MWPLGHCSPDASLALHSGMWGKTGRSSAAKQKQTWGQAGGHVSDLSGGLCLRLPWLVALGGLRAAGPWLLRVVLLSWMDPSAWAISATVVSLQPWVGQHIFKHSYLRYTRKCFSLNRTVLLRLFPFSRLAHYQSYEQCLSASCSLTTGLQDQAGCCKQLDALSWAWGGAEHSALCRAAPGSSVLHSSCSISALWSLILPEVCAVQAGISLFFFLPSMWEQPLFEKFRHSPLS